MEEVRLIDAYALEKRMDEILMPGKDAAMETYIDEIVCAVIHDAPTADAELVVHAEWVKTYDMIDGHDGYSCSRCGLIKYFDHYMTVICTPYCQRCGAKMDGA